MLAEKHNFSGQSASHAWLSPYIGSSRTRSASSSASSTTLPVGVSTWLQYGNKAIEGLPALASTFGSFGFFAAGASPPVASTRSLPGSWDPPHPASLSMQKPSAAHKYRTKRMQDAEMHKKLAARQAEFTKPEKIKIHVCTYNCSGQFYDSSVELSRWIKPDESPDIVVVGLQEMDLRPEVLMVRHDPMVREAWFNGVLKCLNKAKAPDDSKYRLVESKQLAGLCILLFSRESLLEAGTVDEVSTTSVMTGWAGFAGNKGACCVRLKLVLLWICSRAKLMHGCLADCTTAMCLSSVRIWPPFKKWQTDAMRILSKLPSGQSSRLAVQRPTVRMAKRLSKATARSLTRTSASSSAISITESTA